jgi:hypothetical protein
MVMTHEAERLGRVAYEAYAKAVGGVSVRGDRLWTWDEMAEHNPKVAQAWRDSAMAVAVTLEGRTNG